MLKELVPVLHGALVWKLFCVRFRINEQKVFLVLVNDRKRLDYYALAHLEDFMDRKYAREAVILFSDKSVSRQVKGMHLKAPARLCLWPEETIKALYDYYSFYKFSDKIVFTYTDRPKDNKLGRVLRETPIGEEEAVCLGLYRLRRVPELKRQAKEPDESKHKG